MQAICDGLYIKSYPEEQVSLKEIFINSFEWISAEEKSFHSFSTSPQFYLAVVSNVDEKLEENDFI
jgi:hypothetical protein